MHFVFEPYQACRSGVALDLLLPKMSTIVLGGYLRIRYRRIKMFRKYFNALLVTLMLMSTFSPSIFACACCAEPGTYYLRTSKPDSFYLGLLNEITFSPKADLYMTEAGFDMIRGLDPITAEDEAAEVSITEDFNLAAAFVNNKAWRFTFKSPGGKIGSLMLPMPTQMVSFKVDTHDEDGRPNGPLLYKEFRFKGSVGSATGFTRSGIVKGTTFFLVFQGRGNGCDEVQNFKDWRLEIDGPRASHAFYGKLSSADKPWS